MSKRIFFQSSLPRAGSTLLQNVMGQNPEFYVTPTSGVLELFYGARANYTASPEFKAQDSEVMKSGFLHFCRYGLEGFFHGVTDKPYVLDKSRGWGVHYGFLNSFYGDPKIICMVRDLRGVFASMEKNFRKSQHLSDDIVNHSEMTGTTTEKRIDEWAKSQPVGMAIERLQEVFKQGINQKMLFVRFEDLTENPEKEIKRIYEYLGLPYYEGHDYKNVQQITQEDDSVYGAYGDHTIKPEIKPLKKDFKEILGDGPCDWIKNNYKWFYDVFKYN
jgi:sulfotransferase